MRTASAESRYLRPMYSGEIIACQLFSEPAAGSDLAAVTTRAVRNGDGWVVNGQKVWTSVAQHAQMGDLLCRTDPEAPKHKGITAFLLHLDTPGVEVLPLRQITGGAQFNEVFLTDVRISDSRRLGEVNEGWRVALTTLMNERVTVCGESGGAAGALTLERLTALMRAVSREDDGALRRDLASLLAGLYAAKSLNGRAARLLRVGAAPGPERSISKLAFAQNLIRGSRFGADVLGRRIIADTGEWGTFAWADLLLSAPVRTGHRFVPGDQAQAGGCWHEWNWQTPPPGSRPGGRRGPAGRQGGGRCRLPPRRSNSSRRRRSGCTAALGSRGSRPAHLYFRRARASQNLLGGPTAAHQRLLARMGV